MESPTLEEFLLVKLQPGYLEIISEINDLLTSVLSTKLKTVGKQNNYKNVHFFADFFISK